MPQMAFFPLLVLSTSFFISAPSHATSFSLASTAITDGSTIEPVYTCDGKDLSPELHWNNSPASTGAYALILSDPDAPMGTWYHWVIYNIPASVNHIAEGQQAPAGAALGQNSYGKSQYNGPCPPHSTIHRYVFTIYALDKPLSLAPGADAKTVEASMQGHVLSKARLTSVFGH